MIIRIVPIIGLLACGTTNGFAQGQVSKDEPSRLEAQAALRKAAAFYRSKVASHGGYVYYYTEDLRQSWGEGRTSRDTIFVQPPGTPAVGEAYLKAYAATGDTFYLDAAREAAEALVHGQLASGGWDQSIHFAPPERGRMGKYRNGAKGGNWNGSSLDDDQTQSVLRFLMHCDQALKFRHDGIHEAALYGLDALLKAQFANGGFPQVWREPVENRPVVEARYPDYDWRTGGRIKNYWDHYTLNDNVTGNVADVLIVAHRVYGDEIYMKALRKLGGFLVLAQMPDPQPGWCQQYNAEMVPIWARKFEPPAISGSESQEAMETLIKIALYTHKKEYLAPVPRALDYFTRRCLLPDGKVARYYELATNKPLYLDSEYRLTYDVSAAPSHYGWQVDARFDRIRRSYEEALNGRALKSEQRTPQEIARDACQVIAHLDEQGRWISVYAGERLVGQPKFKTGFHFVSSEVFIRNVKVLCAYLASVDPSQQALGD